MKNELKSIEIYSKYETLEPFVLYFGENIRKFKDQIITSYKKCNNNQINASYSEFYTNLILKNYNTIITLCSDYSTTSDVVTFMLDYDAEMYFYISNDCNKEVEKIKLCDFIPLCKMTDILKGKNRDIFSNIRTTNIVIRDNDKGYKMIYLSFKI